MPHKFLFIYLFLSMAIAFAENTSTHESGDNTSLTLSPMLQEWKTSKVIGPSPKTFARTAVLIIAPTQFPTCAVGKRWSLGKAMWEQHMSAVPNVDCFNLVTTSSRKDRDESNQVWIEGNTIYVGDVYQEQFGNDRLAYKTDAALKFLEPHYTH